MIKNSKNHVFKNPPKVIEIVPKKSNFHQKTSKSIKNNSSSPTSTAIFCFHIVFLFRGVLRGFAFYLRECFHVRACSPSTHRLITASSCLSAFRGFFTMIQRKFLYEWPGVGLRMRAVAPAMSLQNRAKRSCS